MALHQDHGTEEQAAIGTLTLIIVSSHISAVLSFSLHFSLQPTATCNYSISHFTPQRHISKVFLWQGRTHRAMVKSWSLFLTLFNKDCQNISSLMFSTGGPAISELLLCYVRQIDIWLFLNRNWQVKTNIRWESTQAMTDCILMMKRGLIVTVIVIIEMRKNPISHDQAFASGC